MNNFELYELSRHTNSGIAFVGLEQSGNFSLHWHEHIEFHFMLSGSLKLQCGDQIYDLKENDCLIINSNELHKSIEEINCKCFCFKLHPSFFDHKHYIFNNLINDDTVISLMLKIINQYQNKDEASVYFVKSCIFQLIGYLCANYTTKTLSFSARLQNDKKIQKMNMVASYIHTHYTTEIKSEALAEMAHYTYSYFSYAFKEVFGMSLTKYILAIRINKAASLLLTTDMNITEIAISSGFPDANYFSRVFKKETGKSPSKYREQAEFGK